MRRSIGIIVFALCVLLLGACSSGTTAASQSSSSMAVASQSPSTQAFAPAGNGSIYFLMSAKGVDHSLFALSARTGTASLLLDSTSSPALSPDGRRMLIVAHAPHGRITTATMNVDGSHLTPLPLPAGGLNLGPGAWSPGSSRIAFEGWDDADASKNGIYTAQASEGSKLARVTATTGGVHDAPISYSPDGSHILFIRGDRAGQVENAHVQLFVVGVDGNGLRQLNPPGTWVDPIFGGEPASWSPDSRSVAFAAFDPTSADDARSAVYEIGTDGSNLHRITGWSDWITSARYSPDGQWVVFDKPAGVGAGHHLFLVHPDGSGLTNITPDGSGECCAQWSPDSKTLVFISGGDGEQNTYLWTVNTDGSGMAQLTTTQGEYGPFVWGP